MLRRFATSSSSRKGKSGTVPVYLNVYDLTPINGYAYWLGLGVYHSGVQVHGIEYGFGAHDHWSTGIFEVEPRQCPGFIFRKSILIGRTELGPREVRALMEKLALEYTGVTYHLITKNCNHFCADVCVRLTGKTIPRWVNRLARLGFLCNCVLPAELNDTKIRQLPSEEGSTRYGEKRKLRTNSSRFPSLSNPPPPSTLKSCSSTSASRSSRQRQNLSRPASLLHGTTPAIISVKA